MEFPQVLTSNNYSPRHGHGLYIHISMTTTLNLPYGHVRVFYTHVYDYHTCPYRTFPMDMAGFAIHISSFLAKPGIKMGFNTENGRVHPVKDGHLETDFLEQFGSRSSVECRGSSKEVRAHHTSFIDHIITVSAMNLVGI